jgi:hypothetical protein
MRERRRVGAIHSEFVLEIDRLLRLDAQNQQRFRAGPGRPSPAALSSNQINLITEGIFLRGFSSYEKFLEEIFVFYARGRSTRSGDAVESFLRPRNGTHARDMIKSHMTFLEWNSPEIIIQRCDIYLRDGGPIKMALISNLTRLGYMRRIRNAIVHRSREALDRYATVVRNELRVMPLEIPNPGEFLLSTDPRARSTYFLISYLDVLRNVADTSAG